MGYSFFFFSPPLETPGKTSEKLHSCASRLDFFLLQKVLAKAQQFPAQQLNSCCVQNSKTTKRMPSIDEAATGSSLGGPLVTTKYHQMVKDSQLGFNGPSRGPGKLTRKNHQRPTTLLWFLTSHKGISLSTPEPDTDGGG